MYVGGQHAVDGLLREDRQDFRFRATGSMTFGIMSHRAQRAAGEGGRAAFEETIVQTADEAVRTTDHLEDIVETTNDIVDSAPEPVTLGTAARALQERFGSLLEAEYIPGKTELRDTLSASFELSDLVAEELCDSLERAGLIAFLQTGEAFGWHIQRELLVVEEDETDETA